MQEVGEARRRVGSGATAEGVVGPALQTSFRHQPSDCMTHCLWGGRAGGGASAVARCVTFAVGGVFALTRVLHWGCRRFGRVASVRVQQLLVATTSARAACPFGCCVCSCLTLRFDYPLPLLEL